MKLRVAFKTLGCRLNQFETDALAADFTRRGYTITEFDKAADVYVVNTCTVTAASDQKSRHVMRQAARRGTEPVVVVTGCMATRERDALERAGATYVVENERKSAIPALVEAHFRGEILQPGSLPAGLFDFRAGAGGLHTRGMLKVQDGCDNCCAFCIIPSVRGPAVSRPLPEVVAEARRMLGEGYRELVLTGVNIGRYECEGQGLDALVRRLLDLEPGDRTADEFRIRIPSIEPEGFTPGFFDLFGHPRMTPHLHLCLQSGSDRVLRRMRRLYTAGEFRDHVAALRARVSDFNVTTDVLVGFPGESDADFEATLTLCREIGFSHIHTFRFSPRDGTRAARMEGQISEAVKAARSEAVRAVAEANRLRYWQSLVGRQQTVLIETVERGRARGYGQHYVPVELKGVDLALNTFIDARLTGLRKGPRPALLGDRV